MGFRQKDEKYPQLEEYAEYFDTKTNEDEPDDVREAVAEVFARANKARQAAKDLVKARVSSKTAQVGVDKILEQAQAVDVDNNQELDLDEFKDLLRGIDKNLRSFPATAQVAAQQGKYLSKLFATGVPAGDQDSYKKAAADTGPFTYFHKGALAYLGNGSAAFA